MSWTRLIHLTLGALLALGGAFLVWTAVPTRPLATHLVTGGTVLLAAGLALATTSAVARLQPGRRGWSIVILSAFMGTVASLLLGVHGLQAQVDIYHFIGYPWSWLERHEWHYGSLSATSQGAQWQVNGARFVADLVFWGSIGALVSFLIRLLRPRPGLRRGGKVGDSA